MFDMFDFENFANPAKISPAKNAVMKDPDAPA